MLLCQPLSSISSFFGIGDSISNLGSVSILEEKIKVQGTQSSVDIEETGRGCIGQRKMFRMLHYTDSVLF